MGPLAAADLRPLALCPAAPTAAILGCGLLRVCLVTSCCPRRFTMRRLDVPAADAGPGRPPARSARCFPRRGGPLHVASRARVAPRIGIAAGICIAAIRPGVGAWWPALQRQHGGGETEEVRDQESVLKSTQALEILNWEREGAPKLSGLRIYKAQPTLDPLPGDYGLVKMPGAPAHIEATLLGGRFSHAVVCVGHGQLVEAWFDCVRERTVAEYPAQISPGSARAARQTAGRSCRADVTGLPSTPSAGSASRMTI